MTSNIAASDASISKRPSPLRERKPWHSMNAFECLTDLQTDGQSGLSANAAALRLEAFGPNELTIKGGDSRLKTFLRQFHQPLVYILLGAAALTAALNEPVDAAVIFGVVFLNAVIGFFQEHKAMTAIAALARRVSAEATVVRDGTVSRLPARNLVPGDIVLLKSGDSVPADVRLLTSRELQINESALTGESVPVVKAAGTLDGDIVLADRSNMAYASTLVTYGQATAVVTETGDRTELGRIATLLQSTRHLQTPLTRNIERFSRILLWVILGLAGATVIAGVIRGVPFVEAFLAAVALCVGAIPEGLPAAVTITLAIAVSRMARQHAVIQSFRQWKRWAALR